MRCVRASIVALSLLSLMPPARADSPARPHSYKKLTPGNEFVFVMVSPEPAEEEYKHFNEEAAAEIREIRQVYARSGMYRNDGSTEPLWTVDWYAHGVDPTADGAHLVRYGPWAGLRRDGTPNLDCEAVSFFANGQLIRTYRVAELIDNPGRLPRSVSHFWWREAGNVSGEFEYTIATLDGNWFVFDVRTGEAVSALRVGHKLRWNWWMALGIAFGVASVGLVWRQRSRTRRAANGSPAVVKATQK